MNINKSTFFSSLNKEVEEILEMQKEKKKFPIKSGYLEFDSNIGGFEKGQLTLIGAYNGHPILREFALSLARNIGMWLDDKIDDSQYHLYYYSLLLSEKQIAQRLISIEANKDLLRLKRHTGLLSKEYQPLKDIVESFKKCRIIFNTTSNSCFSKILSNSYLLKGTDIDVIIIDNLELIANKSSMKKSEIIIQLREVAKEFNIPVIVLSERYSPDLEIFTDVSCVIKELNYKKSLKTRVNFNLTITKNVNGQLGPITLHN